MTPAEKIIYDFLNRSEDKIYVDKEDGSLYALVEGGMVCFTGDFRGMTDAAIRRFLSKALKLETPTD